MTVNYNRNYALHKKKPLGARAGPSSPSSFAPVGSNEGDSEPDCEDHGEVLSKVIRAEKVSLVRTPIAEEGVQSEKTQFDNAVFP